MGVPRLHRFIADRFPYAIRAVTNVSHRGRLDYLYIDFNGLVHESVNRASYAPLDRSEADVLNQTFSYLKELVELTRPQVVYIAIDGAAPNAKIKEQRQRRIFGAIESDSQREFRNKISGYGDVFQQTESLGSAEITPGSAFMGRLTSFLTAKITEALEVGEFDCQFELDDSSNPGEGEHKIIQQLRHFYADERKKPFEPCTDSGYTLQKAVSNKKQWVLTTNPEEVPAADSDVFCVDQPIEEENYVPPSVEGKKSDPVSNDRNIPRVGVFGMDGDLILLLLGLNMPEITLLKRNPGLFVLDIESVENSKNDPWENGIIALDIDSVREGLLYELLIEYFDNEESLYRLALSCSDEPFIKEYTPQFGTSKGEMVRMPGQYMQMIRERVIHSEIADRVIHDFIALALFVGNDFLPEVPGESIKNGALDELIGLYKKQNVAELPFRFLLDSNHQIDLKQIEQMFSAIGENVEFKQVVRDMQDFIGLASHLQRLSDDYKVDINVEYGAMKQELGQDVIRAIGAYNKNKPEHIEAHRPRIMQYYREKYYQKFDQLHLRDQIQCPINLNANQIRELAVLDLYENLVEKGETPRAELIDRINQSPTCAAFKGLHHLIRTYLKTMQWVLDYYLSDHAVFQWSWTFEYPFTPLCSDMAVYCQLFKGDVAGWNVAAKPKLNQAPAQQKLQNASQQADPELTQLLSEYNGPCFVFHSDSPRGVLEQLIFTVPKQSLNLVPEFIREELDNSFFDEQPNFRNVLIAHYESAFSSLNQRTNLSRPNLEFLNTRPQFPYGFGWNPNFTCFYKHYPIGITDGVEFEQIGEAIKKIDTNSDYYKAFYAPLGVIIIAAALRTATTQYMKIDNFEAVCTPGSKIAENTFKKQNDRLCSMFDEFMGAQIGKTYIFVEKAKVDAFSRISYLEFQPLENSQIRIIRQMPISRVCNIHLLSETAMSLSLCQQKMNVVFENINGNVQIATPTCHYDIYVSNATEFKKYANNDGITSQLDAFMRDCRPFKCQRLLQTQIPETFLKQYRDFVQQDFLHNGIVSFESAYFGVPVGVLYQKRFYFREIANGVIGQYADETSLVQETANKNKASDASCAISEMMDLYYRSNKGRSMNERNSCVFILKCAHNIPESHEKWLTDLFSARRGISTQNFLYLAFLDRLSIVPVPLDLIHRKYQRISFLRTIASDFALICGDENQLVDDIVHREAVTYVGNMRIRKMRYTHEQAAEIAHSLFQQFGNVIPRAAMSKMLDATLAGVVQEFEFAVPDSVSITEREVPTLKYSMMTPSLSTFGLDIPNTVMESLLGELPIQCTDLASRDIGFSVLTHNKYDPNYVRDGKPTLRCALAMYVANSAFPELYSQIVTYQTREHSRKLKAEVLQSGKVQENFFENTQAIVAPSFRFDRLPVYNEIPTSQMQLASVISAASLFVHRFAVPINKQMLIPREFTLAYSRDIIDHLGCVLKSVETVLVQPLPSQEETPLPIKSAMLGDFIFSPRHGLLIVVAVSVSSFRAISERHMFSLNSTVPWNALEAEFGDEFYLVKRGAIQVQQEFDYEFTKLGCSQLHIDEALEIDQWLSKQEVVDCTITYD